MERRFSALYKIIYNCIRILGKTLFFIPIQANTYFREAMSIIRAGYWSIYTKIGFGSKIDSQVTIRHNVSNFSIGKFSHIDVGSQFEVHEKLKIGDYVHICPNVYIQSGDTVIIDDYACLTNGVRVYASSNTYKGKGFVSMSSNAPLKNQRFIKKPIHIKRNAFIGMNAVILPGVTIGENAIVGAGSVVKKNVAPNTIVAGVPAKVIKHEAYSST